jgi:nucleoside-diphosphate-sugar epimerase
MKVLVLSGAGFLGQAIAHNLKLAKPECIIVNTTSRKLAAQKDLIYLDYQSQDSIRYLLDEVNPHIILHLASSCQGDQTEAAFRKGVLRDKNIINALKAWDRKVKIIFVASMSCFKAADKQIIPNSYAPESFYGKEKTQMIKRLKKLSASFKNFDVKIVYPSSIYGAGQKGKMFLPSLLAHLKNSMRMTASGSKKRRDYIHISDVSKSIVGIMSNFQTLELADIFLNSGQLVELGEIASMVCSIVGRNIDDVIIFHDSPDDINNYQSIDSRFIYRGNSEPKVPLFSGLKEMFNEI